MNNLISVIVPVYNAGFRLNECLDSIIRQSYKSIELILIDDGSTDNSGTICDEYKNTVDNVVVIHQNNSGVSYSRNKGLDIAEGKYITFVDSDDQLNSTFFENGVNELVSSNGDVYMGGFSRVDYTGESTSIIKHIIRNNIHQLGESDIVDLLECNYIAPCWGKIYLKEFIGKCRFDEKMKFGEDLKFVFELLLKDPLIIADNKPVYQYIAADNSLTAQTDYKKCLNVVETYKILYDFGYASHYQTEGQYFSFLDKRLKDDLLIMEKLILKDQSSIFSKYKKIKALCSDELLLTRLKNMNIAYVTNHAIKPKVLILEHLINSLRRIGNDS